MSKNQCEAAAELTAKHEEANHALTDLLHRADEDNKALRKREAELNSEVENLRRDIETETARFDGVQKAQSALATTLAANVQDLEDRLANSNQNIASLEADIIGERKRLEEADQVNARSSGVREGLQLRCSLSDH